MNNNLSPADTATREAERQRRYVQAFPGPLAPEVSAAIDAIHAAADARDPSLVTHALQIGILGARISARMPAARRPDPRSVLATGQLLFLEPALLTGPLRIFAPAIADLNRARALLVCRVHPVASILVVAERFLALATPDDPRAIRPFAQVVAELRAEPERYDRLVVTALKRTLLHPHLLEHPPARAVAVLGRVA